jgi:hypothetical protein
MAEPSADLKSRYYGDDGSTLDYTHELRGDTLTIWAGERGSPAYFQGVFSADGRALTGAWVYPGGGGYDSNAERVDQGCLGVARRLRTTATASRPRVSSPGRCGSRGWWPAARRR